MRSSYRKALATFLALLPSGVKIRLLNLLGHRIHHTAHIGFSILDVEHIVMQPYTYIGIGNIITGLPLLEMEMGSRINRWNRVTSNRSSKAVLRLCTRSAITLRHYLDVCNLVEIGANTIVAGHRSTFFTHSKGIDEVDFTRPIVIGPWCYLGSNLCVAPGTTLGDHCFVGMGAVLSGRKEKVKYALLVGNPVVKIRDIDASAAYFQQGALVHPHHPLDGLNSDIQ